MEANPAWGARRRGRHCVFALHAHLVFVTKYRRKVFSKDVLDDMRGVFASVCTDFEAELIEMDGEDDHVHLLVNYPPKIPLTKLV
ncbi:MAG TPA: IS200/IS605 family transposase, partial [Xanthobacteraceae bacterium]|nr:IS200/IS605 family transposase [Xanthobacteraceae bacterium]